MLTGYLAIFSDWRKRMSPTNTIYKTYRPGCLHIWRNCIADTRYQESLHHCAGFHIVSSAVIIKLRLAFLLCTTLFACSTKSESGDHISSPKFEQYFVQGEQLYLKHCSNCHQKNGTGLGLVYPPLNKSDFLDHYFEEVLCLMKKGKKGELMVNGKLFNQAMPGIPTLSDLEIAEIATYIYNSWENEKGIIEVQEASGILSTCEK